MFLIGVCVLANLFLIYGLIFNAFGDDLELFAKGITSGEPLVVLLFTCLLSDFAAKILFRKNTIIMNEYLSVRPIPKNHWCGFLLLKEMLNVWTFFYPLLLTPMLFYIMPVGSAVLCLGSLYSLSAVNSIFTMMVRGVEGWKYKLLTTATWFVYAIISTLTMAAVFLMGVPYYLCIYIVFNGLCLLALYKCLTLLHVYGEGENAARSSTSFGEHNTFPSLDYGILVRTRIFGWIFLCYMPLFAFCGYSITFVHAPEEWCIYMGLCFSISSITIAMNGWGFTIADYPYMETLLTKPYSIENLLQHKYYTMLGLTFLMAVPVFVGTIVNNRLLFPSIAAFSFVVGCTNLMLLYLFLVPQKIDLYPKSLFTSNGMSSKRIIMHCSIVLLTFVPYILAFSFLKESIASYIFILIGTVGLLLHRIIIRRIGVVFLKYKHSILELP